MILYPAIDLKDGQCVRLLRGEMDQATVFNDDPAAQAATFVAGGLRMAASGRSERRVRGAPGQCRGGRGDPGQRCGVPAQLGGGIRDMATIETWLDKGLARVILGTVAVENPGAGARGGARLSRPGRGRHRRPQRPRRDQGLGRGDRRDWSPIWPAASRMPASPRSSTPTSSATARCRARTSRRRRHWPAPSASR